MHVCVYEEEWHARAPANPKRVYAWRQCREVEGRAAVASVRVGQGEG